MALSRDAQRVKRTVEQLLRDQQTICDCEIIWKGSAKTQPFLV